MPGDRLDETQSTELAQARRIHRVCEEFESLWRAGASPAIERYLDDAGPGDRDRAASKSC